MRKGIAHSIGRLFDPPVAVFSMLAGAWLKFIRRRIKRFPLTRAGLERVGVFPILRHYEEPLFARGDLRHSLRESRHLPGLDLRVDDQLQLLSEFSFQAELVEIPSEASSPGGLCYHNGSFGAADAEVWYSLVRQLRPTRIVEIGSGWSTRFAVRAIEKNRQENADYQCQHVCIEPYPLPFLASLPIHVIEQKVEDVSLDLFGQLGEGDVLFVDSSHIIRPQGDVLHEYLQVLPQLAAGVIVQVHDIFTPQDYPDDWLLDGMRFFNEQYLLEALLTDSPKYEVLLALNLLAVDHPKALAQACPQWAKDAAFQQPGSFYFRVR